MNIIKIPDVFIVLISGFFILFFLYSAYIKPQGRSYALVRARDNEWIFPLDGEETVEVSGPLGNTVVRIGERRAWVESSPCENQTCVAAGKVTRPGQWSACLPNNVLLIIQGTEGKGGSNDVDAVSF